jgi:hypothetical protein
MACAERPSALLSLRSVGRSLAVIRHLRRESIAFPCDGCCFEIADNNGVSALLGCAATPYGSVPLPPTELAFSELFRRSLARPRYDFAFLDSNDWFFLGFSDFS